jgi:hypothetical protein
VSILTKTIRLFAAIALVTCATAALNAQDGTGGAPPSQATGPRTRAKIQVKLTLVFSRYQGEKKLSSVPYVVPVTTNDVPTSIRMGTRVPVVSTVFAAGSQGAAASVPQASYTYQNVGTEIDCNATTMDDGGTFLFNVTVSDSSVYYPDKSEAPAVAASPLNGIPAFRNFSAKFSAVLRDGQSVQYVAATDPVSGQVVRVDATLNVLK